MANAQPTVHMPNLQNLVTYLPPSAALSLPLEPRMAFSLLPPQHAGGRGAPVSMQMPPMAPFSPFNSSGGHANHYVPGSAQTPPQPRFRSKVVCKLTCRYCATPVCNRGMKAILLADSGVELFSTDSPPPTVGLIGDDYLTEKCHCRIRDVACLSCGNQVGYHVTQPCKTCLDACNNGHFWMFHLDHVRYADRYDETSMKPLLWATLPSADRDQDVSRYEYESSVR